MVTASYLSPGLKEQHSAAVAAGVTVVNEVRSKKLTMVLGYFQADLLLTVRGGSWY